jgi:cholesterol oxidase
MTKITRRKFLASSAALGAAAATYSPLSDASLLIPRRSSRKAVVIGSGFGGSVATLRLAAAGIPVALVERGRHWKYTGESSYPMLSKPGDGLLWIEPTALTPGATGMMQEYVDSSILVGMGAGLGGGSLVYGGVLLQPRREIFQQALPTISYDEMHTKYYPRVLAKVSGGPIPDDILNSPNYTAMREFINTATRAGMDVVRSEVGFNWNIIREEVQGTRKAFASVGEYVFGCNSGAKSTLDRNYLADAAATGNVAIHTLHNVVAVRRNRWTGAYEVHCEVLSEAGFVIDRHIIDCQYLFMAAGSVHTTRLLLRAKALADIPTLNDGVGEAWGSNGDELMSRAGIATSTAPIQGGPPAIAAFDMRNPYKPTAFMHSPSSVNGEFTQLHMGMCIPDKTSKASYQFLTGNVSLNWSRSANALSHQALLSSTNKMLGVGGGTLRDFGALGTWHPLGGVAMGTACSDIGEVLGTPNLFVVDGALIPGSTGAANPSLTIAANAERVMERLVAKIR